MPKIHPRNVPCLNPIQGTDALTFTGSDALMVQGSNDLFVTGTQPKFANAVPLKGTFPVYQYREPQDAEDAQALQQLLDAYSSTFGKPLSIPR